MTMEEKNRTTEESKYPEERKQFQCNFGHQKLPVD